MESGFVSCLGESSSLAVGIVAVLESSAKIENCTNKANVSISDNSPTENTYSIGGICGAIYETTNSIISCKNYGIITGREGSTGQIFGQKYNNPTVTDCQELGTLNIVE